MAVVVLLATPRGVVASAAPVKKAPATCAACTTRSTQQGVSLDGASLDGRHGARVACGENAAAHICATTSMAVKAKRREALSSWPRLNM